jgi:myxalamid-type polyketide synthase MxaE and MxaD
VIRGVVHAAGVAEDRLAMRMAPGDWQPLLAGKAIGALNLHALLPELDLFLMFSSMAAVLPEPGQAGYAAANAVLDALAEARSAAAGELARSGVSRSVGWGIWSGLGMMGGEAGEQKLRRIEARGVHGFSPAQGLQQLQSALGAADPHLLVMPVEWKSYAASRAGNLPWIARSLAEAATLQHAAPAATAALKPAERRQRLEEGIRAAVAGVLKIPAARIDARKPLGTMGLSSLLAMELRNSLEALVGRPLSATLVWNYPTMEALVAYLVAADEPAPAAAPATPATATATPLDIGDIATISDDEAALLLMRRS